jgi:outer membrane protein assembly factor BamB
VFHVKHQPAGLRRQTETPKLHIRGFFALLTGLLVLAASAACYSLPAPQGWMDPVFDGNIVYYSPTAGKLTAYDRSAQKSLWDFPGNNKQIKPEALYGAPVINNDTVFTTAYDGNVYALNKSNGQMRWAFNTGASIIGGALLKDGALYVGNSDGKVYAIQASDGKKLWQQQAGRRVWSTPVEANGLIVVTSMDSDVYAFNSQGQPAWKSTVASAAIASSPDRSGNKLTFGGFDKRFRAIDGNNGDSLWSTDPAGNWFWTQGLLSGDNLYAGNLDGHVYSYDTRNGSLKWQVDLGAPVRSAPALVAGALVVATRTGAIHGLDPSNGSEKWQPIEAGASILANLVPSQSNTVYAVTEPGTKNGAHLLEIDPTTGSSSPVIGQ